MDIITAKQIVENTGTCIYDTSGLTPFIKIKGLTELEGIKHCFTSRLGGVSRDIYESMNMGIHLEDNREHVLENYRRLSESVGFDYRDISCPNQVHKDNILVAHKSDRGNGIVRPLTHKDIDAQITNEPQVALIVYAADCVPILLADPVSHAIGSVHSGWKGTALGISAKTVVKMKEEFGSHPENIHAAVGPSIGPDNYEVDQRVIDEVCECPFIKGNVREGKHFVVKENGKFDLNLWEVCRDTLISAGLKDENIYISGLCTMKEHELFFSHRYTNGRRGLNAGIIVME